MGFTIREMDRECKFSSALTVEALHQVTLEQWLRRWPRVGAAPALPSALPSAL